MVTNTSGNKIFRIVSFWQVGNQSIRIPNVGISVKPRLILAKPFAIVCIRQTELPANAGSIRQQQAKRIGIGTKAQIGKSPCVKQDCYL